MAASEANPGATATGMLNAGFEVLQRQWRVLLAMALVNGVLQILLNAEQAGRYGGVMAVGVTTFAVFVVKFVLGVVFVRMVLSFEDLVTSDTPLRFFTFLGTTIVVGLAVVFGLLLFVIPGILIMMRWYIAPTFVLARGLGVGEALDASRDATNGHRWAIFGTLILTGIIVGVPFMAIFAAAGSILAFTTLAWNSALGLVVIALQVLAGMVSNAMMVGIFATLAGHSDRFDEVFG